MKLKRIGISIAGFSSLLCSCGFVNFVLENSENSRRKPSSITLGAEPRNRLKRALDPFPEPEIGSIKG